MMDTSRLTSILKEYWGYDAFRPMQEEIILSVLAGNDTMALLPTGGGKSICYQVPALAMDGLCLVVSPLIALMKDQVESLQKKEITAYALTSSNNRRETEQMLQKASKSNCKFLYVSPERLESGLFQEYLTGLSVSMIAVDEAHCISQWGYDFRPSYLKIAALREQLPDVPILAVTASATPEVQEDIQNKLLFHNPHIFKGTFLRPNLSFSILKVESKSERLLHILKKVSGTAIVYCRNRRITQELSELLKAQGHEADFYHAGLTSEERSHKQEAWIQNKTRIIVCTNAFGMGIDKPDVRLVVHFDIPDCLENYYQEAGRAGRDGLKCYAVLLYQERELSELKKLSAIRFPSIETIQHIYECIVHYLQIPVAAGAGTWYDFDLPDFTSRFKLTLSSVVPALQLLEQEGWLAYAGQIMLPPKIVFTTNREELETFEQQHPDLEPIIKTLLRTYGGIFDIDTIISEVQLARILHTGKKEIQQQLKTLQQYRILRYRPLKDTPQLQLLTERPPRDARLVHPESWHLRKMQYEKRLQIMHEYIANINECRSTQITHYFGDPNTQPCGICDNCLERKKKNHTIASLDEIIQWLRNQQHLPLQEVLDTLSSSKRKTTTEIIRYLLEEEKAMMNEEGKLQFR
jgi:ATP-dependent DNA helicase RecQ